MIETEVSEHYKNQENLNSGVYIVSDKIRNTCSKNKLLTCLLKLP